MAKNWYKLDPDSCMEERDELFKGLSVKGKHKVYVFLTTVRDFYGKELLREGILDPKIKVCTTVTIPSYRLAFNSGLKECHIEQYVLWLVQNGYNLSSKVENGTNKVTVDCPKLLKSMGFVARSDKSREDKKRVEEIRPDKTPLGLTDSTKESSEKGTEKGEHGEKGKVSIPVKEDQLKDFQSELFFNWDKKTWDGGSGPENIQNMFDSLCLMFPSFTLDEIKDKMRDLQKYLSNQIPSEDKKGFLYIVNCLNRDLDKKNMVPYAFNKLKKNHLARGANNGN